MLSKDEDSVFLYGNINPDTIQSASLINHSSMLQKRKEMMSLTLNSPNGNDNDSNNPSRSYSEISALPSPSSNNDNVSSQTPSKSSHKSLDDLIQRKEHEFGIYPIMERVHSSNYEVKKWFMYYLDQLLGIQCERISNRSRKTDNRDNIYDIDTVNGSFIWKNELRKHWIRSRLERKKLMQQKPPTNPFIDAPIEKMK